MTLHPSCTTCCTASQHLISLEGCQHQYSRRFRTPPICHWNSGNGHQVLSYRNAFRTIKIKQHQQSKRNPCSCSGCCSVGCVLLSVQPATATTELPWHASEPCQTVPPPFQQFIYIKDFVQPLADPWSTWTGRGTLQNNSQSELQLLRVNCTSRCKASGEFFATIFVNVNDYCGCE